MWWLGDAAGALVVTPVLLLWSLNPRPGDLARRPLEAALLLLTSLALGQLLFGDLLPPGVRAFSRAYMCIPVLLWGAFRFGPREVATIVFLLSGQALAGTLRGLGPLAAGEPNDSLLLAQVFVAAMAVMMLAVAAMVSERRRIAEDQRRSEERFRLAVEAAPNAMLMVDGRGTIVLANAHAEELFGYRREELLGRPVEVLVPARFRETHAGDRERFVAAPRARAMGMGRELHARRCDGREVPVEIGLNPLTIDGRTFVLAAVVDISARRSAEQARRDSEERLRLAVEAGRMGTWEWKIASGEVAWSPSLEAIHGLAPGQFPGTFEAYQRDIHPEDREAVRRALDEALERGEHRVEYRVVRPDGEVRWVEGRGGVIYGPGGRPERMVGVCMDVTETRRAAEELQRLLQREQALLAREQAARAEAVAANRAKDDFLAVLSHELRTPLNAIYGWAQLLRRGRLEEAKVGRALDAVERNTTVLAQLVSDLLDVSRIVAGKLRLEMRPVELTAAVHDAVDSLRAEAAARGVALEAEEAWTKVTVLGDPVRLHQVVVNLVSNAVKFTPAGGRVTVRLTERDGRAALVVQDTGQGIPRESLPHVFERFRQAGPGDRRGSRGGLGLGLAIVRHLVEQHGGTVTAESEGEGRGATFTVELPAPGAGGAPHAPALEPQPP